MGGRLCTTPCLTNQTVIGEYSAVIIVTILFCTSLLYPPTALSALIHWTISFMCDKELIWFYRHLYTQLVYEAVMND